jgi:MYXO-CTERM domain-containing protein
MSVAPIFRIATLSPLLVLTASLAHAANLSEMVPKWTTIAAEDGRGIPTGVALDSEGGLLVVGEVAGDNEQDGQVRRYLPDGTLDWTLTIDAGPVEDGSRPNSMDGLHAIAIDEADGFVIGGTIAGDATYASRYLVRRYLADRTEQWSQSYTDGLQSTDQSAMSVVIGDEAVWSTGSSYRSNAVRGRWVTFQYEPDTGAVQPPFSPLAHDESALDDAQDLAHDVAVHFDGTVVTVGQTGVAADDADNADTDWHVRKVDAEGALMWQDTYSGTAGLMDAATGVVIDSYGDVYVVGYENVGTDNADGMDRDWMVVKYDRDGKDGFPLVVWTTSVTEDGDAAAQSIALDNSEDLLIGGHATVEDERVCRLTQWDAYDGNLLTTVDFDGAHDDTLYGVDYRDGQIAVVGPSTTEAGADWRVITFEDDTDLDGFGDSVDVCPEDPEKTKDEGICGCNVSEDDTDKDGAEDCIDDCPEDPDKIEAGVCLCGTPDVDSDGDGSEDCIDQCPDDPNKTTLGECGCGAPDTDTDGDGVLGCNDACSGTPEGVEVDEVGCPIEDDQTDDTGGVPIEPIDSDKGCGCTTSGGSPASSALLLLGALLFSRRRQTA